MRGYKKGERKKVMERRIYPPRRSLGELRTPLTPGETQVFEFFDKQLPKEWEIYVQPHLNGLRPDFVLLHPLSGIAVFEIKDWDLDAMPYSIRTDANSASIWSQNREGKWFRRTDNPIEKVVQYKREILNLYCPRLGFQLGDHPEIASVVTAGVIFPKATTLRVASLLKPVQEQLGLLGKKAQYYPLVGGDSLDQGDLSRVFPWSTKERNSRWMTSQFAADLRTWLIEPDHAAAQREPLILNAKQNELATTRTASGYRRVRGAAGCGKSVALAARAAQLSGEGKETLVITFNLTLWHYLRDLAVRYPHPQKSIISKITWLHFHGWCKRVCQEAGMAQEYRNLWRTYFQGRTPEIEEEPPDELLEADLPGLVKKAIQAGGKSINKYDAILVDEGQDFNLKWWNLLRSVLRDGGEMMLIADIAQDLYGRSSKWTETNLENAGFRGGRWFQLEGSYRFPPDLVPYLRRFVELFLPLTGVDLPTAVQGELFEQVRLRWIQVREDKAEEACVKAVCELPQFAAPFPVSWADIILLVGSHKFGLRCIKRLNSLRINVNHVFGKDHSSRKVQKLGFWMGDARLKGTTIHSFKGWESRAMVVFVGQMKNREDASKTYVALSRLKRSPQGSVLIVVCCDPKLEDYGRSWPVFDKL